ncbi:MAG: phosphoribosylanthranilate isomerase [Tannerellaceae bacterium]|nr:phosphoribosylanthranilate isomerase [Tannerellaceae bacterium]
MIIKVCGMREPENIQQIAALCIDWMGFIFYPKSPRYILKDNCQPQIGLSQLSIVNRRSALANCQLKRVGVFVNETVDQLCMLADTYGLDYLQLHGSESPELCRILKDEGYQVIKVFSIASEEDLKTVSLYEGVAGYFLFDTKCKKYGGSGKKFDWPVLQAYTGTTPFLLSGGIGPDSVKDICDFSHPALAGIDLNSGFEIAPARKDPEALSVFINKIKEIKNK